MLIGDSFNIEQKALLNNRVNKNVVKIQKNDIDVKNNEQSNFNVNLKKNNSLDNKDIFNNNIKNNYRENKEYFELPISNIAFSYNEESKDFVSKKYINNILLSQYPTEEMMRIKINNLKQEE